VKVCRKEAKSAYSLWRRGFGRGCYVNDIDYIEWRIINGKKTVVAVIETTFFTDEQERGGQIAWECLDRIERDAGKWILQEVARAFAVPAYLVVGHENLTLFYVCRLDDVRWHTMTRSRYRNWIQELGPNYEHACAAAHG
jgi:hypothetical protein